MRKCVAMSDRLMPLRVQETWSHGCLEQHGRLAMYVANLPRNRWACPHLHLVLPVALGPTNLKLTHVPANLATGKLQLETMWQQLTDYSCPFCPARS